jgi:hypothetical protein|nr:hypothetical protein Q903MT_gene5369 [Picea sitchensis]
MKAEHSSNGQQNPNRDLPGYLLYIDLSSFTTYILVPAGESAAVCFDA